MQEPSAAVQHLVLTMMLQMCLPAIQAAVMEHLSGSHHKRALGILEARHAAAGAAQSAA